MKPFILLAACVLALTGCTPSPEPQPTETVEESSSTPIPTVEPAVKPALSELVISPDGLGPIVIGQAYSVTDPATDVLAWDETFCGFADDPTYPSDLTSFDYGNWKNTYGDGGTEQFLAEVTYDDGTPESPIVRITTRNEAIRTAAGLGIGSTKAELLEMYGDDLIQAPEEEYYPFVVFGRSGQLVFWFSYETPDLVYMLQVLPAAETAQWSYYSTNCA